MVLDGYDQGKEDRRETYMTEQFDHQTCQLCDRIPLPLQKNPNDAEDPIRTVIDLFGLGVLHS